MLSHKSNTLAGDAPDGRGRGGGGLERLKTAREHSLAVVWSQARDCAPLASGARGYLVAGCIIGRVRDAATLPDGAEGTRQSHAAAYFNARRGRADSGWPKLAPPQPTWSAAEAVPE